MGDEPPPLSSPEGERELSCRQCGADVRYAVGAQSLRCPYCATENAIPVLPDQVGERDFRSFLAESTGGRPGVRVATAKCGSCGAESTLAPHVTHDHCPFCGVPVAAEQEECVLVEPQALLPFKVPAEDAHRAFDRWRSRLWFAPNALKRMRRSSDGLQGVFLPHWTYDTACTTHYVGRRGVYYWVTEHYTARDANGKSVRRTRQVRKTRWYPASGVVHNTFDDLLVPASTSLPVPYVRALEPWGLQELVAHDRAYLAGFRTERYTVDLESGFADAERQMVGPIEQTIRADIGGDTQQIHERRTSYRNITFKHILLPVWISAYRYRDKVYRFLVNARTGEVKGERPWSAWKITGAVLAGLLLIAAMVIAVRTAQ